jgi:hypothetical protein
MAEGSNKSANGGQEQSRVQSAARIPANNAYTSMRCGGFLSSRTKIITNAKLVPFVGAQIIKATTQLATVFCEFD